MSKKDQDPIRIQPGERGRVKVISKRFLRQETAERRGKNTCYSTSIINAAISLGAVTFDDAIFLHERINDELVAMARIWDGSIEHINTLDTTITEIIEKYIPVHVGISTGDSRAILIYQSFDGIRQDLLSGNRRHVVVNRGGAHAYAIVNVRDNELVYIDPLDPKALNYGNNQWFIRSFWPDGKGQILTTPVSLK